MAALSVSHYLHSALQLCIVLGDSHEVEVENRFGATLQTMINWTELQLSSDLLPCPSVYSEDISVMC